MTGHSLTVEPKFTLRNSKLAFLVPAPPMLRDILQPFQHEDCREWLTRHRHQLPTGSVLITRVMRASGYLGSVAIGRTTDYSASFGAGIMSTGLSLGARRALELKQVRGRRRDAHN